jgi:hypothetical protein
MFCLSVREPWATALFKLGKNVENRTWRVNYRGPLAIHVSRTVDMDALRDLKLTMRELFPLGCVVGYVELFDIVNASRSRWARADAWHWRIRNPVRIGPVPVRGRVGLFRVGLLKTAAPSGT